MGSAARLRGPMIRTVLSLLTWFAFLIATLALVARFVPVIDHTVLFIAALSPYLLLGAGAPAVLLLLSRRSWWAISVALLLAAGAVFALLPRFVGSNRVAPESIPIRVLTANLWEGSADPQALIAIARDRADLVVVQELTPESANALSGLESEFPYRAVDARPRAAGAGIWSRYPISNSRRDSRYQLSRRSATLRVPGAAADISVLGAHVVGPWPQPIDDWRREISKLPETLRAAAEIADRGALIVAGDFNATIDMRPFRQLLRGGFRNAGEQSGAGLTPTYPANRSVPPLIGIDHILTYNGTASDFETVRIPGSDHLGVIATIHVPG